MFISSKDDTLYTLGVWKPKTKMYVGSFENYILLYNGLYEFAMTNIYRIDLSNRCCTKIWEYRGLWYIWWVSYTTVAKYPNFATGT